MSLERKVKLALDEALKNEADERNAAAFREQLSGFGYDDETLQNINLEGLKALYERETRGNGGASDHRLALAFDGRSKDISARYGVSRPRRL